MSFVDTHCHLFFESFLNDVQNVVENAINAEVNCMIVPGLNISTNEAAIELAASFESIYAAVGFHPSEVSSIADTDISKFMSMLSIKKVIAVGEIGLDFFHSPESRIEQINLFETMLQIANDVNKPVIIHSRKAIDELLKVLKNFSKYSHLRGVIHAFEGTIEDAKMAIDLGFKIGVGGSITYKNALNKHQLVKELGLADIVLETDSPFLPPHPFRGERNEPARITVIADKISQLTGLSIDEIATTTTLNAHKLFHLGFSN